MVIGINSWEGWNLPSGRCPPDRLCLPSHGCKVVGPNNELFPWGLCVDTLTEGGRAGTTPPRLVFFDGEILNPLRRGGEVRPHSHHHSRQWLPLPSPRNGPLEKVEEDGRGYWGGWNVTLSFSLLCRTAERLKPKNTQNGLLKV